MPQDELYEDAVKTFGPALERLSRAYEADPDKRQDLQQEIHIALWSSFERYEGRCSVRTWVYRVAHNVAASHVARHQRTRSHLRVSLEDIELADSADQERETGGRMALERLRDLIHQLKAPDAQLILLYLEDLDSAAIGEIMGLSPGAVRVQIFRIKAVLKRRFHGEPS
jgi:RNA polymerase sigma-70 factor (ECF subfamily)